MAFVEYNKTEDLLSHVVPIVFYYLTDVLGVAYLCNVLQYLAVQSVTVPQGILQQPHLIQEYSRAPQVWCRDAYP